MLFELPPGSPIPKKPEIKGFFICWLLREVCEKEKVSSGGTKRYLIGIVLPLLICGTFVLMAR